MKIKWNIGRRHLCFFLLFFQLCFSLFNSFFSFFQLCFYLFNCWQLLSPEGGSVANGGGGRVSWVAAGLCRSAPGRPGRPPPWHDLLPSSPPPLSCLGRRARSPSPSPVQLSPNDANQVSFCFFPVCLLWCWGSYTTVNIGSWLLARSDRLS